VKLRAVENSNEEIYEKGIGMHSIIGMAIYRHSFKKKMRSFNNCIRSSQCAQCIVGEKEETIASHSKICHISVGFPDHIMPNRSDI
jgi:hypothetical protein